MITLFKEFLVVLRWSIVFLVFIAPLWALISYVLFPYVIAPATTWLPQPVEFIIQLFIGMVLGFLYMIIAGFAEAYPEADPALVLTPAGEAELPQVDEGCVGDVIRHFAGTPNAELLKPDLASVEPWADLEAANDPGRVATDSPILIVHSQHDEISPFAHGRAVFEHANEPKAFLEITGDHNAGFLVSGARYIDGLREFLDAQALAASP